MSDTAGPETEALPNSSAIRESSPSYLVNGDGGSSPTATPTSSDVNCATGESVCVSEWLFEACEAKVLSDLVERKTALNQTKQCSFEYVQMQKGLRSP